MRVLSKSIKILFLLFVLFVGLCLSITDFLNVQDNKWYSLLQTTANGISVSLICAIIINIIGYFYEKHKMFNNAANKIAVSYGFLLELTRNLEKKLQELQYAVDSQSFNYLKYHETLHGISNLYSHISDQIESVDFCDYEPLMNPKHIFFTKEKVIVSEVNNAVSVLKTSKIYSNQFTIAELQLDLLQKENQQDSKNVLLKANECLTQIKMAYNENTRWIEMLDLIMPEFTKFKCFKGNTWIERKERMMKVL